MIAIMLASLSTTLRGFAIGPLGRKLLLAAVAHRPIRLDEISGLRNASITSECVRLSLLSFNYQPPTCSMTTCSQRSAHHRRETWKNSRFPSKVSTRDARDCKCNENSQSGWRNNAVLKRSKSLYELLTFSPLLSHVFAIARAYRKT